MGWPMVVVGGRVPRVVVAVINVAGGWGEIRSAAQTKPVGPIRAVG
jgi:hypothetical protein